MSACLHAESTAGQNLFTCKSTKNSMWVPWSPALWFGWRHNLCRIAFCSPGKLFCCSLLSPATILSSLMGYSHLPTSLWPILAVMRIQLVNNSTFWGEGKSNVLILHSCSRICINMSWISRCWVLQLGILPFPTTFCFSSGFNLCGLENASRLWGLPKTNNN